MFTVLVAGPVWKGGCGCECIPGRPLEGHNPRASPLRHVGAVSLRRLSGDW
ncbi:hypothetical protein GZL_08442 [Streptomyces sp. 769]|nr:hypothetical protein GZL_08442 [Streptomyces sp. 769]